MGAFHLVLGVLAVQVATGERVDEADQRGVIAVIGHQPFGRLLLGLSVTCMVTYSLWRASLVWRGRPGEERREHPALARAVNAFRALAALGLAALTLRLLIEPDASIPPDPAASNTEKEAAATVLDWPAGRAMLFTVGVVVVVACVVQFQRAATRQFLDRLDGRALGARARRAVVVLGVVGYAARGVVLAIIGWFLLRAALSADAGQAKGLDAALRELAGAAYGPLILGAVAAGFITFGLFLIVDARYRSLTRT